MSSSNKTLETLSHALHVAHQTETGKKVIETVGMGMLAAGSAIVGPAVIATVAPVVLLGGLGYGLWSLFKD